MHDFISSHAEVYKKTNLSPTCWTRYTTRRDIQLCANIPLFSPFWNGGESTFYKMFDKPRVDDVLLVVGVLRISN
jgi:hypothetical protein